MSGKGHWLVGGIFYYLVNCSCYFALLGFMFFQCLEGGWLKGGFSCSNSLMKNRLCGGGVTQCLVGVVLF